MKKAVINVQSTMHASRVRWPPCRKKFGTRIVVSALYDGSEFQWYDDMKIPITLKNIGKFERFNNVSINIYSIKEGVSLDTHQRQKEEAC